MFCDFEDAGGRTLSSKRGWSEAVRSRLCNNHSGPVRGVRTGAAAIVGSLDQYLDQITASLYEIGAIRFDSDEGLFNVQVDGMMVFSGPPTTTGGTAVAEIGAILLLDHSDWAELNPILAEVAADIPLRTLIESVESDKLGWTVWLIRRFDDDEFQEGRLTPIIKDFSDRALEAKRIIGDRLFTEIIESSLTDEYRVIETVDRRIWHIELDGNRLGTVGGIGAACSFAYDRAQATSGRYTIKVIYLHEDAKDAQFYDGAVYFKFPDTYFDHNGNFIEDTE